MGHLQANGFKVEKKDVNEYQLEAIKTRHRVPRQFYSCHTALVGGYVIEGHVPADLIHRLLKEKPAIIGIAVPGMPQSAPGMDGPPEPYDVYTFDRQGRVTVYARRQ